MNQPYPLLRRSTLEYLLALDFAAPSRASVLRGTSIVCTVGPATHSVDAMVGLRKAGMEVMRMNFSHGDYSYHQESIDMLRESFKVYPEADSRPVAIALDTKGPEIRTGLTEDPEGAQLTAGESIKLTNDASFRDKCSADVIYVDYHAILDVSPGDSILLDDGNIGLKVTAVDQTQRFVNCRLVNSWLLKSRKGVTLVNKTIDLPFLSEKDKKDLEFGVGAGVSFIFASFTQSGADVRSMREFVKSCDATADIPIIAKIENEAGCNNVGDILRWADGIMVARGDLGVALPPEKVFLAQKSLIARANVIGKPVICATQMLESMRQNPRPTRAEASDVANAVIDGSDCVMLSGETAAGKYPEEAVRQMARIVSEAESAIPHHKLYDELKSVIEKPSVSEAMAIAAVSASMSQDADAIVVLTETGVSASLCAKFRPRCPVLCVTKNTVTARRLILHRGCMPILYPDLEWESEADAELEARANPHTGLSRWWGAKGVTNGVEFACDWAWKRGVFEATKPEVTVIVVYGVVDSGPASSVPAMRISKMARDRLKTKAKM